MDQSLIGRPVLDETVFVASQHLESVRNKFHLQDFSHIGEKLLDMGKQPSDALSKLLLKTSDIPYFIKDFPEVLPLAKDKNIKQREQIKPSVLDKDQNGVKRSKDYDGDHDVL
jgi:hypothetical protein